MMRQYELVELVLAYNPNADEALLNKAYVYAMQKHGTQKRASGDPYFAHPLEVAAILTELKLDDATIVVALLHDTIEDTDATRVEIDQMFGHEIGAIVEGLTKIDRLNLVSKEKAQAENLRKLLLAVSQDVRVLLVKLADRLHNMRTIHFVPIEKRKRIARETMDIYAPLAGRMGMQEMRSELEDIAFSVLQPEHYNAITDRLSSMQEKSATIIKDVLKELAKKFSSENIKAKVSARVKTPWSTFSKIERNSISLEQLSDVIGFRVIVENIKDCYKTLGVVHTTWQVVPGRFKDYISVPKYNDYRSIHTTIVGPTRQRVELQIRTQEMHEIAEYGIAGHALYKDDIKENLQRLEKESRAYSWLRNTISSLAQNNLSEEFLEDTKLELFQDQVFCFTPRGKLIALPRGATPIDFAYAVHTELGDICVGAKVNYSLVPLTTKLQSGAEVEIITDQNHFPPASWEFIAATGKARAAIRRSVRHEEQKRAATLGEQILQSILKSERLVLSEEEIEKLVKALEKTDRFSLSFEIGKGLVLADEIIKQAASIKGVRRTKKRKITAPLAKEEDGWFPLKDNIDFMFRIPSGQKLSKKGEALLSRVNFNTKSNISAQGVLPGDRVVGILMPNEEITIFPIDSEALENISNNESAWIDVSWGVANIVGRRYKLVISLLALNKPGSLAQISSIIAGCDANIHNMVLRQSSPDFHKLIIELELRDLAQLNDVLDSLRGTAGLSEVARASISECKTIENIDWNKNEQTTSS
ncbi:MAG: bifunctional (p)ppGpp synthetase/guanosine-3',5'-bis(diphosphate) 3'-pyrophosphohydrolase [Devosiaceae bacterium]|nr:bifunctional (p)ppGpp synthetase/guanosine-3',5'-bis(diphosphate) 3'-pyrophosphohydrolase [Devosiaceae bacterium]